MPRLKFNKALIKKIRIGLGQLVNDRMDKVAVQTHNNLSDVTPVADGVARRAWNFTLNKPDKTVPRRPSKGTVLSPNSSRPDKRATKITDRYHLTNATPYIIPLNEGHSEKADPHFIEQAMVDAVKAVK